MINKPKNLGHMSTHDPAGNALPSRLGSIVFGGPAPERDPNVERTWNEEKPKPSARLTALFAVVAASLAPVESKRAEVAEVWSTPKHPDNEREPISAGSSGFRVDMREMYEDKKPEPISAAGPDPDPTPKRASYLIDDEFLYGAMHGQRAEYSTVFDAAGNPLTSFDADGRRLTGINVEPFKLADAEPRNNKA